MVLQARELASLLKRGSCVSNSELPPFQLVCNGAEPTRKVSFQRLNAENEKLARTRRSHSIRSAFRRARLRLVLVVART